ncbi:cytochrome P450 [Kutzneria buriramensis]|uniref:Cytochrome P450 n=1 Tax=Kutzneria buriramensis TaxID=1045776 RepID=A0A3E0I5F9_9PSEU|nr:cytochrome P450 [Kutzneria buriramensis]REH53988.1 cytochrome P450 [Kutzneria buriramensis]
MTAEVTTAPVEAPPAFPLSRSRCPLSPPPEYARLREEQSVSRVTLRVSGKQVWVVTQHEQVRQVLGSPDMSSNWKLPGYPLQVPLPPEVLESLELPLVAMDPPDHTVRRRALIPELTARRMQALRPRIQEVTDEHITAMLAKGGPVDLIQELAVPVPSLVFCDLIGVAPDNVGFFRHYAEQMVNRDISPEEMGAAQYEMEMHLQGLVAQKTETPGDDVLSRVIIKNKVTQELEHNDIVALARMLLFGGFDTTANIIGLGTVALLQNPEQLAQVKADPSLMPRAIEELLRYLSISDSATARVATKDVEIGGVLIRAGEGIIALNGSANRDDRFFANPDELDIHRDAKGHLAFGHGNHQCPGANLVRVELDCVFSTLFRRIPELRLAAPVEELEFKHDQLIYGLYSLPVTW